ncbi:MAG: hypothetical protein RBS05_05830 [Zoogloea oleivorans]|jgi:hypothetical protein|uniref:hypothetical protein n=1 Tax=Zoogloea oleivorans TaxID=1552750 RepID=UPI002A36FC97|nr:hypothetical protein [Zoogloea oleivorans]MDY0035416.1 hypothetical protein [Zoogloea oleivorans]
MITINTDKGRTLIPCSSEAIRRALNVPKLDTSLAAQVTALRIGAAAQTTAPANSAKRRAPTDDGTPVRVKERIPELLDKLPSAGAKDGITTVVLAEKLGWSRGMVHEVVAYAIKTKVVVRRIRGTGVGSVIYFRPAEVKA